MRRLTITPRKEVAIPFDKVKVMEMPTDTEEHLSKKELAVRFSVSERTIERVIEEYFKRLRICNKITFTIVRLPWFENIVPFSQNVFSSNV